VLPLYRAIGDFARLYRDLFGPESALEAYRLLQGFDNKTLAMGQGLWQLSRKARGMPAARAVIERQAAAAVLPALEHVPEGRMFLADLHAYLQEYGQRGTTWSLDTPSWIEDPTPVIKTLQDHLAQDRCAVLTERAGIATERERLVADALARLRGYPHPVVAQFEALLKAAQEATVLSEDHAFWIDFRGMYQVRRVFLEWGRRFAQAFLLAAAPDVFLLTLDELRETALTVAPPTRHALVAQRRAEMEHFRAVVPPLTLGLPRERADAGTTVTPAEPGVLRGTAGSPGHVQGPARVVRSMQDVAGVRQGDILVAEMTSPSWTPLFATVAAVVTATGGVLSHSAIVAREYGIPAVVGLGPETAGIQNGQLLAVDGTQGIVRIVAATAACGSLAMSTAATRA
jgi:pyruvate,water dikinase